MGVRATDSFNVALYDSVTGRAIGTVFQSMEHAEDFLEWLDGDDPRTMHPDQLALMVGAWKYQRLDLETGLLNR